MLTAFFRIKRVITGTGGEAEKLNPPAGSKASWATSQGIGLGTVQRLLGGLALHPYADL
jgi:hypothetical protein